MCSFKETSGDWNGDVAYQKLFLFWKKISASLNGCLLQNENPVHDPSFNVQSQVVSESAENSLEIDIPINADTFDNENDTHLQLSLPIQFDNQANVQISHDVTDHVFHEYSDRSPLQDDSTDHAPMSYSVTDPVYHEKDTDDFDSRNKNSQPLPLENHTAPISVPDPQTTFKSILPSRKPMSPIENILFWPKKQFTQNKRKKKDELPSVLTSDKWKEIQRNNELQKQELETEKVLKKIKREQVKSEKELQKSMKQKLAAQKKAETKEAKTTKMTMRKRQKKTITEEQLFNEKIDILLDSSSIYHDPNVIF